MDNLTKQRMRLVAVVALVVMLEPVAARQVTVRAKAGAAHKVGRGATGPQVAAAYDYLHCYGVFEDGYLGSSYHDMCIAREKLSVCKERIKADFPKIEDWIIRGFPQENEFKAEFWCTHKPDPDMPIEALYYKYNHCPNVHTSFLVLPQDYSPRATLLFRRAGLAGAVLKSINICGLRQWQPQSNYSDPADPVYQALSTYYCALHYYYQYNTKLVDKYCIVGDVDRDLLKQMLHFEQIYFDGLYNWQPSMCPSDPGDPMEKMLTIGNLDRWLRMQVNSSLNQCHASNVAVRGGSCLVMFYTQTRPYTDVHLFMQGFCKPINELHQCWEDIVRKCPEQSMDSDMDVLIKLHQLACDFSQQDSSPLWDVIYRMGDTLKKVKGSQSILQMMATLVARFESRPLDSTAVIQLPFASTLNMTLSTQPHITPQLQRLLKQMAVYLKRVTLLTTDHFQGLNVLYNLCKANYYIANLISGALIGPIELFLMVAGFIDYDPTNYMQWPWDV